MKYTIESSDDKVFTLDLSDGNPIEDIIKDLSLDEKEPIPVKLMSHEIQAYLVYLDTGTVDERVLHVMEYLNIGKTVDVPKEWLIIKLKEDWYRNNVTKKPLDPMHGLHAYKCIEKDKTINQDRVLSINSQFHFNKRKIRHVVRRSPLDHELGRTQMDNIVRENTEEHGVLIAGGSVVDQLLCQSPNDYDLFLYGFSYGEALAQVNRIIEILTKRVKIPATKNRAKHHTVLYSHIVRTEHAITFCNPGGDFSRCPKPVQLILRLYSSISEILHGFDVDACRVGYSPHFRDSKVVCTESALYAWRNRINVIDFERMSPSYDHRVCKYMLKGFGAYVPLLNISRVPIQSLREFSWKERNTLKGLSRIIWCWFSKSCTKQPGDSDYDPLSLLHRENAKHNRDDAGVTRLFVRNEILYGFSYNVPDLALHEKRSITRENLRYSNIKKKIEEDGPQTYEDTGDEIDVNPKYTSMSGNQKDEISFMTINPGQQSTGTFHPTVLKDRKEWYNGPLYTM